MYSITASAVLPLACYTREELTCPLKVPRSRVRVGGGRYSLFRVTLASSHLNRITHADIPQHSSRSQRIHDGTGVDSCTGQTLSNKDSRPLLFVRSWFRGGRSVECRVVADGPEQGLPFVLVLAVLSQTFTGKRALAVLPLVDLALPAFIVPGGGAKTGSTVRETRPSWGIVLPLRLHPQRR